jgi:hypothetical protein
LAVWRCSLRLPPPTRACFPVKSERQLRFLLVQKKNYFFLYARGSPPEGLTLWFKQGGYLVSSEGSCRQRFMAFRRFPESFLARAIRESRLYVDMSI